VQTAGGIPRHGEHEYDPHGNDLVHIKTVPVTIT
jgi:hypothetical protein